MKTKLFIKIILFGILCGAFTASAYADPPKYKKAKKSQKVKKHVPHYRYAKLPRWGHVYKIAPKNAIVIAHRGKKYYYHSGIFYKHVSKKYVIIKAPVGLKVRTLPRECIYIKHRGKKYFYYYGTFYEKSDENKEYVTVDPPVGAKIDALPDGYKTVEIDGDEYYKFESTYYKEATNKKGEIWYEVLGNNI